MDSQRFDIWLHAFKSNSEEPAAHALARVFGISPEMAERLLTSLPRVVRKDAPVLQAQRITSVLESIGGRAEMVLCPLRPAPVVKVGEQPFEEDSLPTPASVYSVSARPPGSRPSPAQTLVMPTSMASPFVVGSLSPSELHPRSPLDVVMVQDPAIAPARVMSASAGVMSTMSPLAPPRLPELDRTNFPGAPRTLDFDDHGRTLDLVSLRPPAPVHLALPPMDSLAPPSGAALRRPSMRARDPHLRTPSSRPPALASLPAPQAPSAAARPLVVGSVLGPIALSLNIVAQAKRSSWEEALRNHPAAGFLLVLLGTTFFFWLLYLIAV